MSSERERGGGGDLKHNLPRFERRTWGELTSGVVERGPKNDACVSERVDKE